MSIKKNRPLTPAGFTLIELLTVIAIIGILAAILIPVVGKVRDNARGSVCVSNMRQVSLAMLMYADDNNGSLPTSGDTTAGEQATDWIFWRDQGRAVIESNIVPYIGGSFTPEVLRCPSDENIGKDPIPSYRYSYTMNRQLGENTQGNETLLNGNIHNVPDPTLIILLVEELAPNDSSSWMSRDPLTKRHSDRGHVSYVAGNVALVTPEYALHRQHWDPFYQGRPYGHER